MPNPTIEHLYIFADKVLIEEWWGPDSDHPTGEWTFEAEYINHTTLRQEISKTIGEEITFTAAFVYIYDRIGGFEVSLHASNNHIYTVRRCYEGHE